MTFVDDDVLPVELAEGALVIENVLIGRDYDVKLLVLQELGKCRSFIFLALVSDHTNSRCPLLELIYPVLDSHKRHHDQKGALVAFVAD